MSKSSNYTSRSKVLQVSCRVCKEFVQEQNYKRHLKNKHPEENCKDVRSFNLQRLAFLSNPATRNKQNEPDTTNVTAELDEMPLQLDPIIPDDEMEEVQSINISAARKRKPQEEEDRVATKRKNNNAGEVSVDEPIRIGDDVEEVEIDGGELVGTDEALHLLKEFQKKMRGNSEITKSEIEEIFQSCSKDDVLASVGYQVDRIQFLDRGKLLSLLRTLTRIKFHLDHTEDPVNVDIMSTNDDLAYIIYERIEITVLEMHNERNVWDNLTKTEATIIEDVVDNSVMPSFISKAIDTLVCERDKKINKAPMNVESLSPRIDDSTPPNDDLKDIEHKLDSAMKKANLNLSGGDWRQPKST